MTATLPTPGALPYGQRMTGLLRPLQRAFLALNRWFMTPALGIGLGPVIGNPVTAHLMLLRTRGRRTGLQREAPLGYVIRDGSVYCVAGYGRPTPWYRNLLADPEVEVVLPGRRFRGRAEPVTDPAEWLGAYRALIASFGLVGRLIVPDVPALDDTTLVATHGSLPIVRIRPVDTAAPLVAGPFDPGGRGWLLTNGAVIAAILGVVAVTRRGLRRARASTQRRSA